MVLPFLKRYVIALQRCKWVGLAGFLGVVGVAGVVAMQPPPEEEYRSEGVLVQNAPVVSFTATGVELQQQGQGIITKEFLLQDFLLQQVSQELAQAGIEIEPQRIRNRTNIRINTGEEGGTLQSVNVSYTSGNREEAEAVLNVLFQGMVELSRVTNRTRLGAIVEALNERLPEVEQELRQAEQALEAYDRLEGPAIQAALDGSLLAAISSSQNQRRQNQIALAGIDAQMRTLQAQLGLSPEEAYASSALSADPIIAQLRANIYEAETQIEVLSKDLRPAHPTMMELQKNLDAYEQLLRERAVEVIGGGGRLRSIPSSDAIRQNSNLDPARAELANQLVNFQTQRNVLLQQQQVLAQAEEQLREQYARLPNKQLERERLAKQVALKESLYDQIQAKRIDAQAAEAETVSSLSVASPPSTSPIPVESTPPVMVLLIGSFLGLVVGGGIIFLLDMLDPTIRIYEDLDKLYEEQDIPLLGLIPKMPQKAALIIDPDHPCNDIYERLRSNLQIAGVQANNGKVPQTVLVTSTRDQEGKTLTAFNLGIASARSGRRTLILELDFRSPSQAWRLGVKPDEHAIVEPLRYYSGHLTNPIQMVPEVENLYISPSVGPQRSPAAVLDASEMDRFLKDAKARFDFIILDVPHLTGSNDAMLMEPRSDGMVMVSRPNFTQKPVLTTTLEQFEENEDLRLLGSVINGAGIAVAEARNKDTMLTMPEMLADEEDEEITASNVPVITPVDF